MDNEHKQRQTVARAKGRAILELLPNLSARERDWAEVQGDALLTSLGKVVDRGGTPAAMNPATLPSVLAYALAVAQSLYSDRATDSTTEFTTYSLFATGQVRLAPVDPEAAVGFVRMFREALRDVDDDDPIILPPIEDTADDTVPPVSLAFRKIGGVAAVALWSEGRDRSALIRTPDAVTIFASGLSARADAAAFEEAALYVDVPAHAAVFKRPCAVTIYRTTKGADNAILQTATTALAGAFSAVLGTAGSAEDTP